MVPEICVHLPNIPGQFSRVLKALADVPVGIRGFSVDLDGALSQLHLLFTDAADAEKAIDALAEYGYETIRTELLLLSHRDAPGELLRVTNVLAANDINVAYGYYVTRGQAETGEVLFALKVADGQATLALERLAAHGITEVTARTEA